MTLVGHPLPPFSLPNDRGELVTNRDLAGSWTVLYAYPKDATPGCTQEACDFRDAWARLQAMGVRVLGISRDSLASHGKFIAKQDLPFGLLSDPDATLLKALGAFGPKVSCGRQSEGILRSTFLVDPEGIVRHAWLKVSVKGHVQAVLDEVAKLCVQA